MEREIDTLPIDVAHRERKLHDMNLRLDSLYDAIAEIEEHLEDAQLRKEAAETEAIALENIYKILLRFGELYDIINDEEKKTLVSYLIKEIQIYPTGEGDCPLKSIKLNFPIYQNGQEVREIILDKHTNVETFGCAWAKIGKIYTEIIEFPLFCPHFVFVEDVPKAISIILSL